MISLVAGVIAGGVTGFLHTVFEIPAILAGILTQIALWSINPESWAERVIFRCLNQILCFHGWWMRQDSPQTHASMILGVVDRSIVYRPPVLKFFGNGAQGRARATGNNEDMIRALGVNIKKTKMLALMISNGLVGLSGGLVCQSQKYGDINNGTGAIVIGLAAIVIGDVLMGRPRLFWKQS